MKRKRCPVCGEKVTETGRTTKEGRLILSCGDAVWYRTDKLGRRYWSTHFAGVDIGKSSWGIYIWRELGRIEYLHPSGIWYWSMSSQRGLFDGYFKNLDQALELLKSKRLSYRLNGDINVSVS